MTHLWFDTIFVHMSPEAKRTGNVDLAVNLAGIRMSNPVMTASGTSGYGPDFAEHVDLEKLGAFVTKAISPELRKGNPPPRTVETAAGMLNAIGLANLGLDRFVAEIVPFLQTVSTPIIVNVVGHSIEDYQTVCDRLDPIDCISGLELNVSCPNVADGLEFGTDAERLENLVASVRPLVKRATLIVKLSPNVTDIVQTAQAALRGGADVLSVINTLRGMAINADLRRPILANRCGGLSGPAIKPVALYCVDRVYTQVARDAQVPIIGMGGVYDWRDAAEFLLAGATAIAVGTALFVDPTIPMRICEGLATYLRERGLTSTRDLIGQLG
ncbi:MAG: dihydroorotate dehydrogenase [Phycisphaerales bacterium]|nr:MAG: dihydroorotate dehydrogenase [Phycisphaerales bacterium]